jgi:hypothetical protein
MKIKFTLLLILATAFSHSYSQAWQLPNDTFQHWTNTPLAPDGWCTLESIYGFSFGLVTIDTASADQIFPGRNVLRIKSDSIQANPALGVVGGIISLGTAEVITTDTPPKLHFNGEAFAYRPDSLITVYNYYSPGTDTPMVQMVMSKAGAQVLSAFGALPTTHIGQWVILHTPLAPYYLNGNTPDTLLLQFTSSNTAPVNNSQLLIGLVLLGYQTLPSGLQEIANEFNFKIYPNPSASIINISSAQDADGYKIIISDLSGRLMSVRELSGNNTSIAVSSLSAGLYVYMIADQGGNILNQGRFEVVK